MIGLELEMIGEMKDGSLNDQIEYETDFVEVSALETEPWTMASYQSS